ncbi:MAG: multidrug effflux MFS transporter [Rhizobiales bacterium]|nr:multidrug effflux MFS transporter [Hyphomicrobiales bacterium]NRB15681.1 multidrug effflux MFS transporter [Hyphomicrobiales bacterium]
MTQQNNPKPTARPHIMVLVAVASIGTLALNIFIPSMPNLVESLGTTQSMAQLTLTFYLASLAFAQLIIGPLSDKYGRRPVLLWSIAIYVAASLASGLATNIETLISARVLQALGGCSGIVITRAIIRDIYSKQRAAGVLGYIIMVVSLAPMLAPIIGAYIDQWFSWRGSFYFVALFGIFIGLIAYKNLHETNFNLVTQLNLGNMPKQYWALLREPEYMGYALSMSFNNAVFFSFITGAPFIISDLMNLTPGIYALYFMLVSGGYMLGNFLVGRFSARIGTDKMIHIGNINMLLGVILAIYCFNLGYSHPIILFGPMGVIAISAGMIGPNAIAGLLDVKPEIAGTASGLSGFLQMMIAATATFLVSWFYQNTGFSMIFFMALFACLSCLSFYTLVVIKKPKPAV